MQEYGQYVDVLGVSVDSFSPETNALIGRGDGSNNNEQIYRVRDLCAEQDIIFKMNTVVNKHNWEEDMMSHVQRLRPERWKVFQVLLLEGENSGLHEAELRDARPLVITDAEFWAFVHRHKGMDEKVDSVLIPEPNDVMQNSYLLLDEDMCFLDCSQGGKVPSQSILEVGVEKALSQAGFDFHMFQDRGGVYNWKRERDAITMLKKEARCWALAIRRWLRLFSRTAQHADSLRIRLDLAKRRVLYDLRGRCAVIDF